MRTERCRDRRPARPVLLVEEVTVRPGWNQFGASAFCSVRAVFVTTLRGPRVGPERSSSLSTRDIPGSWVRDPDPPSSAGPHTQPVRCDGPVVVPETRHRRDGFGQAHGARSRTRRNVNRRCRARRHREDLGGAASMDAQWCVEPKRVTYRLDNSPSSGLPGSVGLDSAWSNEPPEADDGDDQTGECQQHAGARSPNQDDPRAQHQTSNSHCGQAGSRPRSLVHASKSTRIADRASWPAELHRQRSA